MKRNPKAAGEFLGGIDEKTLANWRSAGKGPAFFKVGGRVMYDDADLDKWLAACRRESTAQSSAA